MLKCVDYKYIQYFKKIAKISCDVTELKDDRIEKYSSLFVFISKKYCRATLKNLLADGKFFNKYYATFSSNFAKLEIKNLASWYTQGAPSALMQIVHYSSSYYTVFHSVIF